jgi:hypothetical protein
VLELLAADADLPQGDRGAGIGAAKDEQGRQALEQGGPGVVMEPVAAFAAHGLIGREQPGQVGIRQGRVQALGSTATHSHSAAASRLAPTTPASVKLSQRRRPARSW